MKSIRNSKVLMTVITSSMVFAPAVEAFEAKISGQVSRMVVAPDDAVGNEIQRQNIGWSGSSFRFTGSEETDDGLTWDFRLEIQARNYNAGTDGSQLKNNGDNQDNRYQNLYLSGALDKGDGASNGGTGVDLSGTALAFSANPQDNRGGYKITPDTEPRVDADGEPIDNSIAWKKCTSCLMVSVARTVCVMIPRVSMDLASLEV